MTETDYIRSLVRPFLVKEYKALVIKYHGSLYAEAGVSDLLCCIEGRFCAFEVKVGKNQPTEAQQLFIRRVQEAGGHAGVVHVETYEKDIEEILL